MNTSNTEDRKSLKQKRVSAYFVQAAKGIILTEGVENVSVRKVADLAGYAFSTMYKYYRDLDALLRDVKAAMIRDMVAAMTAAMPEQIDDAGDFKKVNRTYASYYLEYPHVFRFFYAQRLDPEEAQPVDLPDFGQFWYTAYAAFVQKGVLREADVPMVAKTFIYALHGLIALYFAGYGMTKEILFNDLDQMTDYLLGERK
jgi:AcrR family transcriptional regulator